MKKQILLTSFLVLLLTNPFSCFAGDNDFEPEPLFDTIIVVNNKRVRVKSLEAQKFKDLYKKHAHKTEFSIPLTDMRDVEKLLAPDFKFSYVHAAPYGDSTFFVYEVRYLDKLRIIWMEDEGFMGYYPRERIFTHMGGHSSDHAFIIDTGASTFNPYHSRISESKKFRVSGLHTGQDSVEYDFEKYDSNIQKYNTLFTMYELGNHAPMMGWMAYINEQFFVGDTLYFRTGYDDTEYQRMKYMSITILD